MRVLKAIAVMLTAVAMVVLVWCERAGKFVLRCLPSYRPPDPQGLVDEYVDAAETAPVTPAADERMRNIGLVADALFRQAEIPDAIIAGLSDRTIDWLQALDADMLLLVSNAKPQDLGAHIAGTKAIRGLLAFDQESVAAYIEAAKRPLNDKYEPELEYYHRRRPRRQEPLLPAFGPMC
jgi:hypothetical protein